MSTNNIDPETIAVGAMEARARCASARVGLIAIKSDAQIGSAGDCGQFQLVDLRTRRVVGGQRYELSASDVIQLCTVW